MNNLFIIPVDEIRYLIYSPLKKTAFIGNSSLATLVKNEFNQTCNNSSEFLSFLYNRGFFTHVEAPVDDYSSTGTVYDTVILFLTNQCNLRCRYCYAHSGEYTPKTMSWETARSAIDFAWSDTLKHGLNEFTLGFHGGGEPTLNRDVLIKSIEYAESLASANNIKLNISGAFNGCWSGEILDFAINHFTEISISLDGVPSVQDIQRPKAGGAGSFSDVDKTLKAIDASGIKYGLRMTVTDYSVSRLSEGVEYLCKNYRPLKIQAEPVFEQGRAVGNNLAVKDLTHFIAEFIRGYSIAKKYNIELFYSGARPDLITTRFCLAACRAFVVTTDGDVTTCFESYGREHPLSSHFLVGSTDRKGSFNIDSDRLNAYFRHTVYDNNHCVDCFCKWHCAGDCAIKTMRQDGGAGYQTTGRCYVNREITLYLLLDRIREYGGIIWLGDESPEDVKHFFTKNAGGGII